jgi:hypothetical protein
MLAALHFLSVAPTFWSLSIAIAIGGAVYAVALTVLYPGAALQVMSRARAIGGL